MNPKDKATGILGAQNSLVVTHAWSMHDTTLNVVETLTKNGFSGIYVTLNRPHVSVLESFRKKGINDEKVYFIDCVTSSVHHITHFKEARVLYADSPRDLGKDGVISRAVEYYIASVPGKKFVLIDALRTMLLYNEEAIVVDFIKDLVERLSAYGVKLVVLTRKGQDKELIADLSGFFDFYFEI